MAENTMAPRISHGGLASFKKTSELKLHSPQVISGRSSLRYLY